MDGPIVSGSDTIRADNQPTGLTAVIAITGINPYMPGENYEHRILTEECDNGGIYDEQTDPVTGDPIYYYHGCDEFCRIIDGWTCTHYYHHLIEVEYPLFTSRCEQTVDPACSPTDTSTCSSTTRRRRRLSPDDFDKHGRLLHHVTLEANKYTLPTNDHDMREDRLRLHFSTTRGTNG